MLSFKQLQEKKTKIKINPKKDEIVEGQKKKKDDSYLETNMKKRQANNEKARKDMEKMGTSMKNPHFESTNQEESAYDSQEEVSEESNQEIEAETEIPFLTFDQYQHARTLDEEQLNEFLGKLISKSPLASAIKKPINMPAPAGRAAKGLTVNPVKKEEVEQVSEVAPLVLAGGAAALASAPYLMKKFGSGPANKALDAGRQGLHIQGSPLGAGARQKAIEKAAGVAPGYLSRSKGGKVKKEEVEQLDEYMANVIKGMKGPVGKVAKQSIKPGGNNSLGVRSDATSAGGGKYFTNNARLLARNPGSYIRGTVPEPPKTAPKVNSSANAVRPGMGSSSSNVRASGSSGPRPNRPVTASNALRKREKREHYLRSFGSFLNERTRYAKETGKDFTTGNPSEKGGEGRSEVGKHMQKIMRPTGGAMSSRKKAIQPQGKKKEKGKKGYEGVTPVDKIKNKLSRKRAPKKDPYGYGQGRYQGD